MKKIFNLLLVVLLALSLVGCSSNGPEKAVKSFLDKTKAELSTELKDELYDEELFGENEEIANEFIGLISDFEYKIEEAEVDKEEGTVRVNVTTYDLGEFILNYMQNYIQEAVKLVMSGGSDEDIEALMKPLFEDAAKETKKAGKNYSTSILIPVIKEDGEWVVDEDASSYDLEEAILGGLAEGIEKLNDILN